ncbi:MAG: DUF937 domain-containing protein, partial [Terrimesophilobacter sp.]
AEGDKIVSHVFGSKKDDVVKAVSGSKGVSQDIIAKILPIVAPIVLAWLANKFFGGQSETTSTKPKSQKKNAPADTSGGIGDLLGGLLGGSGGDLLGGLLGGGSGSGGGGGILGNVLGGLLGGKK